jgi:hypothetical protein
VVVSIHVDEIVSAEYSLENLELLIFAQVRGAATVYAHHISNDSVTQVQRAHPLFEKPLHALRGLEDRVEDKKVATAILSALEAHNGERMGAVLEVQRCLVRSMHLLWRFGGLNAVVEVCLDLV